MIWVGRITGFLILVFSLALGLLTLLAPDRIADGMGLAPLSEMGRSSVRANTTAFFMISAFASIGGLFAGRAQLFFIPAIMFGVAATGRIVDVLLVGATPGVGASIVVEVVLVLLALIAAKWSAH